MRWRLQQKSRKPISKTVKKKYKKNIFVCLFVPKVFVNIEFGTFAKLMTPDLKAETRVLIP